MPHFTTHLDSRLNRLIDGELSPDEYRTLLSAMDVEPEGWRRCALAFLESQALAADLGTVRHTLDEKPVAATAPHQASHAARTNGRSAWPVNTLNLLAIAASFIAAFSLGIFAPSYFSTNPQDGPLGGNFTGRTDEPNASATYAGGAGDNRQQTLRPVGNLRLVMDGANGESIDAGEVPVYETGANLQEMLAGQQAMGPELVELLRRHGFDVQHEQRYVPAPLDDGRQVIVPVDGYQIIPIGGRY